MHLSKVMALPLHLLIGLIGVNRRQKAGLTALFCLGFLIIAVALVRVFQTRATKEKHADPVWLALWSQIEASVGEHAPQTFPLCLPRQLTLHSRRRILPPLLRLATQQARPLRLRLQKTKPILVRPLYFRHTIVQLCRRRRATWDDPSRNVLGRRFAGP